VGLADLRGVADDGVDPVVEGSGCGQQEREHGQSNIVSNRPGRGR
jgi:hypothetical protein